MNWATNWQLLREISVTVQWVAKLIKIAAVATCLSKVLLAPKLVVVVHVVLQVGIVGKQSE